MNPEVFIAIISGAVAILVAIISKTNLFSDQHRGLTKDIELYTSLPDSSTRKNELMHFIDHRVNEYIKISMNHRRNGTEIAIGVIFLIIGGYLIWFFIHQGSWWLVGIAPSLFALLIGIFGLVQGSKKVERDEKGNAITEK